MNSKLIAVPVVLMICIGVGILIWNTYRNTNSRINTQTASIYEVTGEPFAEQVNYIDAITWQALDTRQCVGLNTRGQALIGTTYRKSFSFSRGCKIIDRDLPNPTASNVPNSERFWFGGLVGSQCYSVTSDSMGNPNYVFLEQGIKDKEVCLIN